jgi:hypothetical protein
VTEIGLDRMGSILSACSSEDENWQLFVIGVLVL